MSCPGPVTGGELRELAREVNAIGVHVRPQYPATSGDLLEIADTLERLADEQEAAQVRLLRIRSCADWLVGFLSVPVPMSETFRERAHRKAQELLAEITAAQTASSEPERPFTASLAEAEHGCKSDRAASSGSLDAEAENWCYYTWPANAGSSKGRTAAFEAANLGSSPSPAVSLDAVADAAQVKSALNELVDYADTSYTAAAEKVWVEGRAALERLLAGKAAG